MIGGTDIPFETRLGSQALDSAARAALLIWRSATFENGEDGTKYDRYEQVPFGHIFELFVYRDKQIEQRWDEEGAVTGLEDTMIHLILSPGRLTAVVDDPDSREMGGILRAIESSLWDVSAMTAPFERNAA
jgi:hypothetical protein